MVCVVLDRWTMTTIQHNPDTWNWDAWERGYYDTMYDGMDLSGEMPCQCDACMKAYRDGQEAGQKDRDAA